MILLKAFVAGICGAVVAAVLWIVIPLVLPVVAQMLFKGFNSGSAGIGAVSIGIGCGSIMPAEILGFVIGAALGFRRFRVVP